EHLFRHFSRRQHLRRGRRRDVCTGLPRRIGGMTVRDDGRRVVQHVRGGWGSRVYRRRAVVYEVLAVFLDRYIERRDVIAVGAGERRVAEHEQQHDVNNGGGGGRHLDRTVPLRARRLDAAVGIQPVIEKSPGENCCC